MQQSVDCQREISPISSCHIDENTNNTTCNNNALISLKKVGMMELCAQFESIHAVVLSIDIKTDNKKYFVIVAGMCNNVCEKEKYAQKLFLCHYLLLCLHVCVVKHIHVFSCLYT